MDLDSLFREFNQPLVRYLTRRLGDRDWAEEVAQETFMRAARQKEIVNPERQRGEADAGRAAPRIGNERSWLFAVATNLVRDEARKDARRRKHLELLAHEERERQDTVPQLVAMENRENAAAARKALDALSERDREALLMREEGLDYNEIAAALELSVASVGTTLSRARRRLVEAFEAQQAEGRNHAAS